VKEIENCSIFSNDMDRSFGGAFFMDLIYFSVVL